MPRSRTHCSLVLSCTTAGLRAPLTPPLQAQLCVGAGGGLFRSWAEVTDKLLGGRAVDVAKVWSSSA